MSTLVAVVAGVGRGTGSSIALKFASKYPVVCLARNADSYNGVVDQINSRGGKAVGFQTDLTSSSSVNTTFDRITKEFGGNYGISVCSFLHLANHLDSV